MRSKGRIVFIVASCVSVMLVIIIGIMVFREARTLRKDGQTLDIRKEKLRMDQGLDPFPSTPNVLAISNNWVHLSKELQKLSRTMGKGQIVPDKRRSRVQWITLLAETQKQLRNLAATNSIVLPEGFAFGFELYDEGAPPASHNVPRLTQQILMVDALCRTLYDAGIEELKSIKRTEFEAAATGGTTWKGRRGLATVTNILAEVYTEECFSLEYDARESAFLKSLNGLASHDMFIVVSDVELEGHTDIDIETEDEQRSTRRRDEEAPDEDGEPAVTDPRERSERIVSGPGKEVPATVTLVLDVYTFLLAEEKSIR